MTEFALDYYADQLRKLRVKQLQKLMSMSVPDLLALRKACSGDQHVVDPVNLALQLLGHEVDA